MRLGAPLPQASPAHGSTVGGAVVPGDVDVGAPLGDLVRGRVGAGVRVGVGLGLGLGLELGFEPPSVTSASVPLESTVVKDSKMRSAKSSCLVIS
eukprot:scaffold309_cov39-Phaeocystis_antarctica.AAC.2